MNLLLFQTRRGHAYPVIETPPRSSTSAAEGSGRGSQIKKRVYQAYRNLRNKLDYQERICSQLRRAVDLRVYHPSTMDAVEAQKKLRDFLRFRYSKHSRWLWIDAVLAFLGIFFMPVPGPNIFFFYPAARTLGHYFAREGAKHILSLDTLCFQSDPLMDEIQNNLERLENVSDVIGKLEECYNLQNLETFLTRLKER